jgi:predicted nucleic acid-binding protein
MTRNLYVDSSVVLRSLLGASPATTAWFDTLRGAAVTLVASRLGELEVHRVAFNAGVDGALASAYTDRFAYIALDDALIDEAQAIAYPVKSADALHLAAALRLGPRDLTFVTHDQQLATAAAAAGFIVEDPVTDDPGRRPVA